MAIVEIAAGLGIGKTTLSSLLARNGFIEIFEKHEPNPFIEKFYEDPAEYGFESEVTFLMQHYHDIKEARKTPGNYICDFSLTLDRAYAENSLCETKKPSFRALHSAVVGEVGHPELLLYLTCPAEVQLERIRKRGRPMEKDITLEYLHDLSRHIEDLMIAQTNHTRVMRIDTGRINLLQNQADQDNVMDYIMTALTDIELKREDALPQMQLI